MSAINTYAERMGPSFSSALWVTGLLLRLGMIGVFIVLLSFASRTAWPFALIIIADLFVFAYQVVRFVNAASLFYNDTGRFWTIVGASVGYVVAGLVTFVLWFQAFMVVDAALSGNRSARTTTDNSPSILETRAPPKRFRMHLSLDGRVLTYDGIMSSGMMNELEPLMSQSPDLQQITLNSPGGNLYEARRFAQRVLQYGLDTHVAIECSSSCLLAFTAGANRTLGPGAQLGFHRYGLDFKQLMPYAEADVERLQDQRFFEQQQIDSRFIERYFQDDRRALWYPHKNELLDAGIITKR
ncbi:hypothetical protein [Cognatishimia sp.]|uniref:COG3904 family protein n=1 Tax=Cognatishimia sp. TaxID=2211648 RepID=UPI0035199622